ncbi:hypothetical protein GCM10022408_10360 [Hymenobacter fastidiosus]|uniref:RNA polymerase sigma factor 70 region 4 type 2 domain-containing protein n=1 Tax=Hymenobacter fastidiosus TaxID=486264 RepID=A0ABP7RRH0_9BACT
MSRKPRPPLEAALALLPQCPVVFTMSRYEELSYQQIADPPEISPKTVENQMGKALRIMRKQLSGPRAE